MTSDMLRHESLYRSERSMAQIYAAKVVVCGAGAIGGNLAENLARSGIGAIKIVDFDRVEERNLGTQPYLKSDVGSPKAKVLAARLYGCVGIKPEAEVVKLTEHNVHKLLGGTSVIADCFDNSLSRRLVSDACMQTGLPCVHVGFSGGFASVLWNDDYHVPPDTGEDVCDYPLARNLAVIISAVAAEIIIRHVLAGEKKMATFTIADLGLFHG